MKTTAVIEKGKDGTFGIFTPDIDHVIIGEGATVAEAKADFENSVAEMLASYKEEGIEVPEELQVIEFEYKYHGMSMFNGFDPSSILDFYSLVNVCTTGPNVYISEPLAERIEAALHEIDNAMTIEDAKTILKL